MDAPSGTQTQKLRGPPPCPLPSPHGYMASGESHLPSVASSPAALRVIVLKGTTSGHYCSKAFPGFYPSRSQTVFPSARRHAPHSGLDSFPAPLLPDQEREVPIACRAFTHFFPQISCSCFHTCSRCQLRCQLQRHPSAQALEGSSPQPCHS